MSRHILYPCDRVGPFVRIGVEDLVRDAGFRAHRPFVNHRSELPRNLKRVDTP